MTDNTEQIRRIARYEALFDEIAETVRGRRGAYGDAARKIDALRAYYESDLWKRDFADDEAGRLPRDLKRGVLSEDGVYLLLEEADEWRAETENAAASGEKTGERVKDLYVSPFTPTGGNANTDALKALFADVKAAAPQVAAYPERDPFPEDPRIKAIRFAGLPCEGKQTTVFAYLGFPADATAAAPVPAMVLVHGGGGHAYAEWVRYWVDSGFAAISFDGFSQKYTGPDHTYETSLDFWAPDPETNLLRDCFISGDRPFAEQGFTYFLTDISLAHSLLRADDRVIGDRIGLTGISWGGFAASIAVCYDERFAFAAPVYGCGFNDVSRTPWGAPFRDDGVADVWDAKHLLGGVEIPLCFFSGDADPFFDANALTASAAAAPRGALTLLPGFTHGQIEGAAIPELMRFALEQVGRGDGNIRIRKIEAGENGAALTFTLPDDAPRAAAFTYYKTEDLIYEGKDLREAWKRLPGETADGRAGLRIPRDAALFYFSVAGEPDADSAGQTLHASTGIYSRETWNGILRSQKGV